MPLVRDSHSQDWATVTASLDPTVSVASPLDPRKSSSLLYRALQLFLFLHKAAISHRLGTRGSPRLSSGIHEQKIS